MFFFSMEREVQNTTHQFIDKEKKKKRVTVEKLQRKTRSKNEPGNGFYSFHAWSCLPSKQAEVCATNINCTAPIKVHQTEHNHTKGLPMPRKEQRMYKINFFIDITIEKRKKKKSNILRYFDAMNLFL